MSLNQQTTEPTKRPTGLKMQMLKANIANRRQQVSDNDSKQRIFDLLVKSYLTKNKDSFAFKGQKTPLQLKAMAQKRKTMMDILMNFKKILRKK